MHVLFSPKITERRRALRRYFDVARQFDEIEESCVPSYVHGNKLAAWVAWTRLLQAARFYEKWAPDGDVLDFGSATGELGHLIDPRGRYWYVEQNDLVGQALQEWLPDARRIGLDDLGENRFAVVFALDSLEHNDEIEPLIARLEAAIMDSGIFILSGPTENFLYRLGRRIARFKGHYHLQTVWDVEAQMRRYMLPVVHKLVPMGIPMFSISVWRVDRQRAV